MTARGIPHLLVLPCLVLTFLFGRPAGCSTASSVVSGSRSTTIAPRAF